MIIAPRADDFTCSNENIMNSDDDDGSPPILEKSEENINASKRDHII